MSEARDYHNMACVNFALVGLLLMPYALIRYGLDSRRARRAARGRQ